MKLGFLVSGGLGETVLKHFLYKVNIPFVLTDKKSTGIMTLCAEHHIPVYAGNPRKPEIDSFLQNSSCDILASVNYLFLIEKKVLDVATGMCFNVHGSLLPKYRGRTPHVWAIINNEKQTGITAHLIDEGCDTGAIIKQVPIEIEQNDTGAIILQKFNQLYIPLIEQVLASYKEGTITFKPQNENEATYFGKRTEADGLINWEWQKERIYNWVRAQAHPYPGAFSYCNDNKIIIHEISYAELGFKQEQPNGLVLSGGTTPIIKTPNGAVQLLNFISANNYPLNTGDLLT